MLDSIRILTTSDNAKITYRVMRGETPRRVILLLHGMTSNMTRWSEFVEQTELKNSWDLLRPDLRGNGRSVYRGRIALETWCDDLAAILDEEGYAEAVLVGHCLGATIAVHFAARYPERTAGLVLIEPLFPGSFEGVLKKIQPYKMLLGPAIFFVRMLNRLGLYRRHLPLLDLQELDQETRGLTASPAGPDALVKRYASLWFDLHFIPTGAYLQSLRELFRPLPALAHKNIPALLLFSTGKLFSDPEKVRKQFGPLQRSTTVVLDSHHWIPTEKPVEMRNTIEQWCRDLSASLLRGKM